MLIPISKPLITEKEIEYVTDAVKSGWISSIGHYIERFERLFAEYCGAQYALATSNGTTALHLALSSIGITTGDEVIVPDLTFIATANAVTYTGARPIFVDIDPITLCIDPRAIRKALNKKVKAIIPVHLYGHPCEMDLINEIAAKHGLIVIEDAAEAHGAEYKGGKVGSLGDIGVFSFYGNKIITTGEGGMLLTNNTGIYERARHLRDHAMSKTKRYWHDAVGYNYRITNIQAALGLAQLERIDTIIEKKRRIFALYKSHLANTDRVTLNRSAPYVKNVYWAICLEIDGFDEKQRDEFITELKKREIDSRPYFHPISDFPMYEKADTPITHSIYRKGLLLPTYEDLSDSDVRYICDNIKSLLKAMETAQKPLLSAR